ncbi:MAG: phosphoenolpyruvate carboxykinase, partial [Candidatus Adiutrix sp.]|nr:phosphoenolpyruvate carboxykinase [Candidatus Adiutrix sp.]
MAESIFNTKNNGICPRIVSPAEAYDLAAQFPWVTVTDLDMEQSRAAILGLEEGTKVIVDNHGATVGRSAGARVFYNRLSQAQKGQCEGLLREGVYDLQRNHDLIMGEAVVGLDSDLMFKARMIAPEEDAANLFFWFANF